MCSICWSIFGIRFLMFIHSKIVQMRMNEWVCIHLCVTLTIFFSLFSFWLYTEFSFISDNTKCHINKNWIVRVKRNVSIINIVVCSVFNSIGPIIGSNILCWFEKFKRTKIKIQKKKNIEQTKWIMKPNQYIDFDSMIKQNNSSCAPVYGNDNEF